ncbi:MAG: hypothetical protein N2249_08445 [Melioribacter sp.]|nr:hypothetical protein [Melioribacter sp.]
MKIFFHSITTFFLIGASVFSQNLPKFSGLMFGDYFYNLSYHNSSDEGMNGFQFRRIFITADYTIAENFNSRFRLEADNISNRNSTSNKMNVWVKDAYLEWVNVFTGSNLYIGLSPTPAFETSTKIWNHRFIEKTILDYNSIVSARDMGIDLRGNLINGGKIKYWFKVGNNMSGGPENNKYKRFYASFEFYLLKNFIFITYGDFTTYSSIYDEVNKTTLKTNSNVLSLFLNYKYKKFSFGIESFLRNIKNGFKNQNVIQDLNSYGISLWAYHSIGDKFTFIGRYDFFDGNAKVNKDGYSLFIFAFDYKPTQKVHIAPNFELTKYENGNKDDFVPRLTFFWEF